MRGMMLAVLGTVALFALASTQPVLAGKPAINTFRVELRESTGGDFTAPSPVVATLGFCNPEGFPARFPEGCLVPLVFDLGGDGATDVTIVKAAGGYRDKKGEIFTVSFFFKDAAGNSWVFLNVPASSTNYDGKKDSDGFIVHVHQCGLLEPGKGQGDQVAIGSLGPVCMGDIEYKPGP